MAPVRVGITSCAVAFAVSLTTGARVAVAQPFGCYTIQPGDTASYIALRLTGSVEHRYEPWFQIVDTARSRVITKAEYGRIRPGWRACMPESRLSAERRRQGPADRVPRPTVAVQTLATFDPAVAWWGVAVLLVVLLAWRTARSHVKKRHAITNIMQRFGEQFICEFERPLIQPGCVERPLESRLRVVPRRKRLEILLAPTRGRRYPNLSDHRRNVKYDVERVLRRLKDARFAGGELHARGRWVIVACQFRIDPEQEGVN